MKGKQFVNFLSFVSIVLIALTLVLEVIFGKAGLSSSLVDAMGLIAQCIAYVIAGIFAFMYAKSKQNVWFMVAYFVAVVLIIVMVILNGQTI